VFLNVFRYFVAEMFITLPPLEVTDLVHANPAYVVLAKHFVTYMSQGEQGMKIVEREDGHDYFLIDRDRSKGDRRCDGKLNADFFGVESASIILDNVRVSQRLEKKSRLMQVDAMCQLPEQVQAESPVVETTTIGILDLPREPRLPDKCIKCAGRKRTSRLLWLHEFYIVYGNQRKKKNPYIYQALQFLVGAQLPEGAVREMSDKQRCEIWVLGICYVPSDYLRKFSTRHKGYMFHTDVNDVDADKFLFRKCPEVVRVENCLKWHPMCNVERSVPRVVHPDDVKQRRINVAGRGMHFVCGVSATQDVERQTYTFTLMPRATLVMYPEERYGMEINSSSIMWEHVEEVFTSIRQCMSSARHGTASASFKLTCLACAHSFWKVVWYSYHMLYAL
jgi:hypothetical protein